ncbi:MAG: hypothetical protein ACXW32_04885 [Limisphaerales bacterium]
MMQVDVLLDRPATEARTTDRVRQNSSPEVNHRIDQAMMKRVWHYAKKSREEISARITVLDREWDLERVLEAAAAGLSLGGVFLSIAKGRRWLVLPAAVLASLLQHSLTRRSLPVQLIRAAGVRTRREIEAEKTALRMLRGDFDKLEAVSEETHRAIEALRLSRS